MIDRRIFKFKRDKRKLPPSPSSDSTPTLFELLYQQIDKYENREDFTLDTTTPYPKRIEYIDTEKYSITNVLMDFLQNHRDAVVKGLSELESIRQPSGVIDEQIKNVELGIATISNATVLYDHERGYGPDFIRFQETSKGQEQVDSFYALTGGFGVGAKFAAFVIQMLSQDRDYPVNVVYRSTREEEGVLKTFVAQYEISEEKVGYMHTIVFDHDDSPESNRLIQIIEEQGLGLDNTGSQTIITNPTQEIQDILANPGELFLIYRDEFKPVHSTLDHWLLEGSDSIILLDQSENVYLRGSRIATPQELGLLFSYNFNSIRLTKDTNRNTIASDDLQKALKNLYRNCQNPDVLLKLLSESITTSKDERKQGLEFEAINGFFFGVSDSVRDAYRTAFRKKFGDKALLINNNSNYSEERLEKIIEMFGHNAVILDPRMSKFLHETIGIEYADENIKSLRDIYYSDVDPSQTVFISESLLPASYGFSEYKGKNDFVNAITFLIDSLKSNRENYKILIGIDVDGQLEYKPIAEFDPLTEIADEIKIEYTHYEKLTLATVDFEQTINGTSEGKLLFMSEFATYCASQSQNVLIQFGNFIVKPKQIDTLVGGMANAVDILQAGSQIDANENKLEIRLILEGSGAKDDLLKIGDQVLGFSQPYQPIAKKSEIELVAIDTSTIFLDGIAKETDQLSMSLFSYNVLGENVNNKQVYELVAFAVEQLYQAGNDGLAQQICLKLMDAETYHSEVTDYTDIISRDNLFFRALEDAFHKAHTNKSVFYVKGEKSNESFNAKKITFYETSSTQPLDMMSAYAQNIGLKAVKVNPEIAKSLRANTSVRELKDIINEGLQFDVTGEQDQYQRHINGLVAFVEYMKIMSPDEMDENYEIFIFDRTELGGQEAKKTIKIATTDAQGKQVLNITSDYFSEDELSGGLVTLYDDLGAHLIGNEKFQGIRNKIIDMAAKGDGTLPDFLEGYK
jgi:hypothetical protein